MLNVLTAGFETSGDPLGMVMAAFLICPVIIALAIGWLWVAGWLWQRIGVSRVGTAWRGMAVLLFGAMRREGGIGSEPVKG